MFTFLLKATLAETAGAIVDLRTSIDRFGISPVSGVYDPLLKGWRFDLHTAKYTAGFSFKFFIHPNRWQENPNLEQEAPEDGETYTFELAALNFQNPAPTEPPIELGRAQRRLFDQRPQAAHLYDVIVIGSGIAGAPWPTTHRTKALMCLCSRRVGCYSPRTSGICRDRTLIRRFL